MKKQDIVLSIMVSSILTVGGLNSSIAAEQSQSNKIENKPPASSGKCASGKCGTEKIYSQANLQYDPQDQIVRARDGKCGSSGKGISQEKSNQINVNKCIGGICGS